MIFNDRIHAAELLTIALKKYAHSTDTLIIGIPRGGVVLAAIIANKLSLPLDITCPRKIGAPYNPEFAIGAITETGEGYFNEDLIQHLSISKSYLQETINKEKAVAAHRLASFRKGLGERKVEGKTIILVDDGLATGSTMKAAIISMRSEGAKKIVVAVPVSPRDTLNELERIADEVVCLETPPNFMAVGQFYHEFGEVFDEDVIKILKNS